MSTCYKTSDNKYFDCPPRMSDGRHFTDYRPNCEMNSVVKMDNKISNSFEYRNFLQQNASLILDINRKHACQKNCCGPTCQEAFLNSTMLPEQYKVNCDNHTCTRVLNDPKGLGDGRVYYTTPESCEGLPASWPQSGEKNTCVSPFDNFSTFGSNEPEVSLGRLTVPGGGKAMTGGDRR